MVDAVLPVHNIKLVLGKLTNKVFGIAENCPNKRFNPKFSQQFIIFSCQQVGRGNQYLLTLMYFTKFSERASSNIENVNSTGC